MTPWLEDADVRLYHGDVLAVLRELPAESVDCCVTSPPYWGLRDYGTGAWNGGDEGCDHLPPMGDAAGLQSSTLEGGKKTTAHQQTGYGVECGKCGATRIDQQLGLEPTPEEYVTRMVEVFREVRRVLAAHGTVWLNLGDSYASDPGKGGSGPGAKQGAHVNYGRPSRPGSGRADGIVDDRAQRNRDGTPVSHGLKAKDLVGIPWRVAFALQADGWYLRSDIIWAKPNPMPESVTDRPTKAHEYVFLLSKQPRYFFDQEAVREPAEWARWGAQNGAGKYAGEHSGAAMVQSRTKMELQKKAEGSGRNIRSVWEIATQPYPEAHFATFPEELARRCIAAGCPADGAVMDPFVGSGTVPYVARKLGRHAVGIDLNEEYLELAARRLQQQSLFAEPAA